MQVEPVDRAKPAFGATGRSADRPRCAFDPRSEAMLNAAAVKKI